MILPPCPARPGCSLHRAAASLLRWVASLLLVLALCAVLPGRAVASITASFESLGLDNFTGDLIASDRDNAAAGYDRDALHAHADWRFSKSSGGAEGTDCEWRFLLLEETSGSAVPLNLPGGGTGPMLTIARRVSFNLAISNTSRTETILADLSPATRLIPGTRYLVRCQFWRDTGAGLALVEVRDDAYRRIWHFPYLVPGSFENKAMGFVQSSTLQRNNLVRSQPGQDTFKLDVTLTVRRYDVWTLASPITTTVPVPLALSLTNVSTSAAIPLTNAGTNPTFAIPYFAFASGIRVPSTTTVNITLDLQPSNWSTLDPVPLHRCVLSARDGDDQNFETHSFTAFSRYLTGLTGDLYFGPLRTTFAALTNDFASTAVAPTEAGYRCRGNLSLAAGGGTIPGKGHTFFMTNQEVHMAGNGNLFLTNPGTFLTSAPPATPDRETINNTIFERGPVFLNSSGAQSNGWKVFLPRGMGFSFESAGSRRRLQSKMIRTGVTALGSDLLPPTDPTAGNAGNPALITLERLPFIFTADQLTFVRSTGQFTFAASTARYLREQQAEDLDRAARPGGTGSANPAALRHYSNEELYRHCEMGNLALRLQKVETAADGSAYLRDVALRPKAIGAFYAHYPYEAYFNWNSTAVGFPGLVYILNDRMSSSASVQGSGLTYVRYERDCHEAAACTPPAATAGYALIANTPTGNRWKITESGGLTNTTTFTSRQLQWGTVTTSPSTVFA